jgi:ferritin
MKIKDKVAKALNAQIREELASGYIYLGMAAYFEDADLPGFAQWMKIQAGEEYGHAMKLFAFINEREGSVELGDIKAPDKSWGSPLAAFEAAYDHEKYISDKIDGLVKLAEEEGDRPTVSFLKWFIDEQVEEEASTIAVVKKLKQVGESPQGLYLLDKELGSRSPE